MPVVKLEIQETKSTVLVAKTQASVTITKQPITLTVNQSSIDLNAVQSAATVVIQKANVSLGITNSVNTITLGNSGPQGIPGIQGLVGPANTLSIGTVTTSPPGAAAEATITGTAPNQTLSLVTPRGDQGIQGIQGIQGDQGLQGDQGIQGVQGDQGIQGIQGVQGIQGETGPRGFTSSKGTATLDFGSGAKTTETVVTGYPEITADSVVMASMRIAATAEHPTDDLLVDPIRLAVKDLVVGVGFTIYGEMDNAEANGTYTINWIIR